MRKIGVVSSVTLSTGMTQIIGPSEHRVAILFSPPALGGQSYTVSTDASAALGAGLNLTSNSAPILITEELFGDAVRRPWFAVGSSGFAIGFLETIRD